MLGRRQRTRRGAGDGALTGAPSPEDDDGLEGETAEAGAHWEAEDDDAADDEYEGEYDDEYDDEGEYDDDVDDGDDFEDADSDGADEYDDEEDGDDEQDGGAPEPFTPPTFLEAAKQAFRPNRQAGASAGGTRGAGAAGRPAADAGAAATAGAASGRSKAQPATGTEDDARAVNLIDRRERMIGFVLSLGLFALSALAYFADHRYKNHNLTKQADVRHAAVEVLGIFAVLGAVTLVATLVRRRALLGFILAFAGLALLQTLGLFGLIYLAAGGWLIFRAMKTSPRSRARQAAVAGRSDARAAGSRSEGRGSTTAGASSARAASGGTSARSGSASAGTAAQRQIGRNNRTAAARGAPSLSGRYTPPKQNRRPLPSKQPDPPEPSNRLTAWLRK